MPPSPTAPQPENRFDADLQTRARERRLAGSRPSLRHFTEFHESITGKRKRATSNFENYAGKLTETILLGNLAVWAAATGEGKAIEWDAATLTAKNAPEVSQIIKRCYRPGYEV